jgi:MFS family permease
MLTGIFVTIMDTSIVNVAIPSIRSTLGASFAEAELVVAGYAFTFAVGLITGGRLGGHIWPTPHFLGFGAFTVASALCGLAPWPTVLVISRLQVRHDPLAAGFRTVAGDLRRRRERSMAFAAMKSLSGGRVGQILGGVLAKWICSLSWARCSRGSTLVGNEHRRRTFALRRPGGSRNNGSI